MRYGNDDSNVNFEVKIMESSYISLCNNKRIVINPYYKVVMDLCHLYPQPKFHRPISPLVLATVTFLNFLSARKK